jgi:hypothetical protein
MLLERAEAFAKEKKARGIYVDMPALNQSGRSFYEAVGCRYGYSMPKYIVRTFGRLRRLSCGVIGEANGAH